MGKKIISDNNLIPLDNSSNELFDSLETNKNEQLILSYIPSFFTTASLPFKNINKTEFIRKASNGISLILNSPSNVPFGRYGRLLLSIFTTHAVLSKEKNIPVIIEFDSMSQLLKEMQPRTAAEWPTVFTLKRIFLLRKSFLFCPAGATRQFFFQKVPGLKKAFYVTLLR